MLCNKRSHHNEKPVHHNEEYHPPHPGTTRENLYAAAETQCSQKKEKLNCCVVFLYLSPGEGKGNQLQYSCLGNPIDGGAWKAIQSKGQRVRHDLGTKQLELLSKVC